jgi:hypothetical protein
MSNPEQNNYVLYKGNGFEYGEVVVATLHEFRSRKPEIGEKTGELHPAIVYIDRDNNSMKLNASDCAFNSSGEPVGHSIDLDLNRPNRLRSNFSDETVLVRTPRKARQEMRTLIDRYKDATWRDLYSGSKISKKVVAEGVTKALVTEEKIPFYSQGRSPVVLNGLSDKEIFWLGVLDTITPNGNLANKVFSRRFEKISEADQKRRKGMVTYYALPIQVRVQENIFR